VNPRIAVVDHGAGNLVSIAQGLVRAGAEVAVIDHPGRLAGADVVVLPGVGATAAVMEGIRRAGFEGPLRSLQVPLFGICVGMQVLFESSEEDGADCLGLIPGRCERITAPRLPHIGWNDLTLAGDEPLFEGLGSEPVMYFVHSYAPVPTDPSVVTAWTQYGTRFVAAVRSGMVAGTQFHPERSGPAGLTILSNLVLATRSGRLSPHPKNAVGAP
jgi:glutamine amidotransferase